MHGARVGSDPSSWLLASRHDEMGREKFPVRLTEGYIEMDRAKWETKYIFFTQRKNGGLEGA